MNFNAQLSCQGTVKDDVTKFSLFYSNLFVFFLSHEGYSFISTRKNEFSST